MSQARQIAFLTGRSDPARWALSRRQGEFLECLRGAGDAIVTTNFPYQPTVSHRPVPLWRASWNNLREYLVSRRRAFAIEHGPEVARLIEQADETWFVAVSCGLELFNNLKLPVAIERRCTLICLGPVARRWPRHARTFVVRGTRDVVSRLRTPTGASPVRVACGHLGYLDDPAVLRHCRQWLHSSILCSNTSA